MARVLCTHIFAMDADAPLGYNIPVPDGEPLQYKVKSFHSWPAGLVSKEKPMATVDLTSLCDRRWFLSKLLLAGIGGPAAVPALIRNAVAMGALKYPSGVQRIQGRVTIN